MVGKRADMDIEVIGVFLEYCWLCFVWRVRIDRLIYTEVIRTGFCFEYDGHSGFQINSKKCMMTTEMLFRNALNR